MTKQILIPVNEAALTASAEISEHEARRLAKKLAEEILKVRLEAGIQAAARGYNEQSKTVRHTDAKMTAILTDERKAAILEHLRENPVLATPEFLKGVLIDPDNRDKSLTDEMIYGILSDGKPAPAAASESDSPITDRVDTDQEPDLYVTDSEFPDYATNWDGTVICLGGARKKKGKRMRPYAGWAKTASGKFYPTCYFRLSQGGIRHIHAGPPLYSISVQNSLNPKPRKSPEEVGATA